MSANLKMRFHPGAEIGIDVIVDVIGDFFPNVLAANFYHTH
ncbi:MAG TPA: hypothetical protein VEU98_07240 [Candidatus Eremiobacteraceae bacterium]|nr:hypothetical protein [Candidatus Eremiobacteraceae bacterium]